MSIRNLSTPRIRLNTSVWAPPLTMEMDRFFEFSFWIAEELLDLESEYADWKTPASEPLPVFDANGLPEELDIQFD